MSWRIREHLRAFPLTGHHKHHHSSSTLQKLFPAKSFRVGNIPNRNDTIRGVKSGCKCYYSNHMSRLAMTLYKGFRTWAFSFRGMHLPKPLSNDFAPIRVAFASFCMVFEREHYYKSLSHISYLWRRSLIRSEFFAFLLQTGVVLAADHQGYCDEDLLNQKTPAFKQLQERER